MFAIESILDENIRNDNIKTSRSDIPLFDNAWLTFLFLS